MPNPVGGNREHLVFLSPGSMSPKLLIYWIRARGKGIRPRTNGLMTLRLVYERWTTFSVRKVGRCRRGRQHCLVISWQSVFVETCRERCLNFSPFLSHIDEYVSMVVVRPLLEAAYRYNRGSNVPSFEVWLTCRKCCSVELFTVETSFMSDGG